MNDDDEVRGWRAAAKVAGRSVAGMQKLAAGGKVTVGGNDEGAVFSRAELLALPPVVVRLVEPVEEAALGDLTAGEAAPAQDGPAAELSLAGAGEALHASQPSTGAIPAPVSSPALPAAASAGPAGTEREALSALHVQRLRLDLLETRLGWREAEITRLLQDRRDDRKRIAALERELSRRPLVT